MNITDEIKLEFGEVKDKECVLVTLDARLKNFVSVKEGLYVVRLTPQTAAILGKLMSEMGFDSIASEENT